MGEVRFRLDENMPGVLAKQLRRSGIDVTTSPEEQLLGASDTDQLAHAFRTARVLCTQDQDMLILAAQDIPHAGIVFWHSERRSLGHLVRFMRLVHAFMTAEEMNGSIEFVP